MIALLRPRPAQPAQDGQDGTVRRHDIRYTTRHDTTRHENDRTASQRLPPTAYCVTLRTASNASKGTSPCLLHVRPYGPTSTYLGAPVDAEGCPPLWVTVRRDRHLLPWLRKRSTAASSAQLGLLRYLHRRRCSHAGMPPTACTALHINCLRGSLKCLEIRSQDQDEDEDHHRDLKSIQDPFPLCPSTHPDPTWQYRRGGRTVEDRTSGVPSSPCRRARVPPWPWSSSVVLQSSCLCHRRWLLSSFSGAMVR